MLLKTAPKFVNIHYHFTLSFNVSTNGALSWFSLYLWTLPIIPVFSNHLLFEKRLYFSHHKVN